jgi:hypothetical protein
MASSFAPSSACASSFTAAADLAVWNARRRIADGRQTAAAIDRAAATQLERVLDVRMGTSCKCGSLLPSRMLVGQCHRPETPGHLAARPVAPGVSR